MNTPRFFLSEADGHLYRDGNLSAPFRKNIVKWHSHIKTVYQLKATIRAADRAFGGVSLVVQVDDGSVLCESCVRFQFRNIAEAVRDKLFNGWRAVEATTDSEISEGCRCLNCDEVINEEEEIESEHNFDDDFIDSDPWRGGPEGDLYG